jgi:hypothetical protein
LRKYLIAAAAATVAVGGGVGIASAAAGSATMKVTVAPKNAGTAKKPTNSSVALNITNQDQRAVLSKLVIQMPKTLKVSNKGFPACSKKQLDSTTLDAKGRPNVCKGSRVGSGIAAATLGANTSTPGPLNFKVTALTGGKNQLFFYLHSTSDALPINVTSPGKVKNTKKGPVLTVTVPQEAQFAVGLWNGLKQLKTTLKGKKGKHLLIGSTGCKSGKQPFSTQLVFGHTFAADGTTNADGSPHYADQGGYKTTVKAASACTK